MSGAAHNLRRVANVGTRWVAIRYGDRLPILPVVGYPKSGTTWFCHMLAASTGLPFAQFPHLPVAMPSVVHGHWKPHPRLRNATLVVRDGRDAMVSFYFFCLLCAREGMRMRGFRALFAPGDDPEDVVRHLPAFIEFIFKHPIGSHRTWPEYNAMWLDKPGVATVRYEDLHRDAGAELARVTAELGRPAPAWRIERAVEDCSMQRATGRRPGEEDRASATRKGVVGDWESAFSAEARELFADLAGDALVALGYERARDWRTWGRAQE